MTKCDNYIHYCWDYDRCDKWNCYADEREVHEDCFEGKK